MTVRRLIPTLLALAMVFAGTAMAQEAEREQEREKRLQEAQREVEQAQHRLQEALEQMRRARDQDANRALRLAMEALRDAQRYLRSEEFRELMSRIYVAPRGEVVLSRAFGRPRMGVILAPAGSRSATDSVGVKIQAVTPGGPADEAGIKAGDILVSVNGHALGRTNRREASPNDKLVAAIRESEKGDTLRVVYRRDGETGTADVVVQPLESSAYVYGIRADTLEIAPFLEELEPPDIEIEVPRAIAPRAGVLAWSLPFGWLDMEMVTLNEELGGYFGVDEGILITRGPRDDSFGLKSGDVILNIDGRKPSSPSHALRIMRSYDAGESMQIEIMRDKRRQTVTVTVPERDRGFLWRERR